MNDEIKGIAEYWVNNINILVERINMAAIDDKLLDIMAGYESKLKIQAESDKYSKFNKRFLSLAKEIEEKFIFEPERHKSFLTLLPELKRTDYSKWEKERYKLIEQVNRFKEEFDLLVEKNIKAKVSVLGIVPTYNKEKQAILFGKHFIALSKDGLVHAFCMVLFNMTKDERLSWDEFWEKMQGSAEDANDGNKAGKKQVYDTLNRVNYKITKELGNEAKIARWKKNGVERIL